MRIIGLDVGEKRIGVAKVDSSTKIAVPVGFLNVDDSLWQEIAKIASFNNTNFFVLGLPRSNEGNETAQTLYVRNFARVLIEKIPKAKVRFQDESLTSVGDIDAEAASIILQDFIESFKDNTGDKSAEVSSDPKLENVAEKITENTKAVAKKEADKLAFEVKKAKYKGKKLRNALIISPILLVLILGGITAVLKYRDYVRWQREEEYARLEAEKKATTFNFTVRPGETIFDVKKHLLEVDRNGVDEEGNPLPKYTEAEVEAAFKAHYDFDFLAGRPEGASLEGFLYPETHNFYSDSTVEEVLTGFLKMMNEVIQENDLASKYQERGLSLFDGITLASVVQKEASSPEQPKVAQVFLTRLDYGMTLGSDVTVSYALDVIDPKREVYKDNAAALAVDSCYNTRLHGGLPCGPISNPGLSALLAVANPSDTSYLYFLTGDDGVMYYSSTEYEHNQNIYHHCKELCNVSL